MSDWNVFVGLREARAGNFRRTREFSCEIFIALSRK